jgi:hypothetical protein
VSVSQLLCVLAACRLGVLHYLCGAVLRKSFEQTGRASRWFSDKFLRAVSSSVPGCLVSAWGTALQCGGAAACCLCACWLVARLRDGLGSAAKDEHICCPTQFWGQNKLTKNFDTDAAIIPFWPWLCCFT